MVMDSVSERAREKGGFGEVEGGRPVSSASRDARSVASMSESSEEVSLSGAVC